MFDIFDQHWTLLIIAAVTFRIIDTIASDTHTWWNWYPLMLLIAASYAIKALAGTGIVSINDTTAAVIQLLLTAAILGLFAVPLVRAVLSQKQRWWLWLVPVSLATASFAVDGLIKTDREAITELIHKGMTAVEQQNPDAIDAILAENYSDSYHNDKAHLMRYCTKLLSKPLVEKNKKMALLVKIAPPAATATLSVLTIFDEKSFVRQQYFKPTLLIKLDLQLQKEPGKGWLIRRAEILEIDRHSANWHLVR